MVVERDLVQYIREETSRANRNNVTRTQAYFKYYLAHPEIQWAYLAHFVSRNTGWNMTDLEGDILPRLISREQRELFFSFLERNNGLIFLDAYPQLLLYAASKKQGKPLFHLLPFFQVSRFMQECWSLFWRTRDTKLLTYALITNEQQHIEQHVVKHPYYQANVLKTILFWLQSVLRLNYVFFPYYDPQLRQIRLAGTIVQNFEQVNQRIRTGKRLYTLLFKVTYLQEKLYQWALETEHTGSRADYWSELFSKERRHVSAGTYTFRLAGEKLHQQGELLYSPHLESVWPDVPIEQPVFKEWFTNIELANHLLGDEAAVPYDLTEEYLSTLNRLELAVVAKEKLLK